MYPRNGIEKAPSAWRGEYLVRSYKEADVEVENGLGLGSKGHFLLQNGPFPRFLLHKIEIL